MRAEHDTTPVAKGQFVAPKRPATGTTGRFGTPAGATRPASLEVLFAFAVLAALTAAEVGITGNSFVVSHPMWLDESVTSLLLNDPRLQHMLAAIHGGADTNGPAFYFGTWPVAHLVGGSVSELRLITAGMMLLALAGIYMVCRFFVEPARAAVGVFAAAVHPFVVVQMWQVRMYGFWLAAIAWFCVYTVAPTRTRSWPARLVGCVLAALVVTAHWLGVFALVLVSLPAIVETRSDPARRWNHLLPMLTGLLTLALCVPLILSQRHILSVPTWIDSASLTTIAVQLRRIVLVPGSVLLVVYALLRIWSWRRENGGGVRRPGTGTEAQCEDVGTESSSAGTLCTPRPVLALLAYPVVLVVMSVAMQSVLIERYMLPVVIPIALVTALAALPLRQRWGRLTTGIAIASLLVVGCLELNALRRVTRQDDDTAALVIDIVQRSLAAHQPVVFARRFEAYPLIQARPQWADSVAILDFPGNPDGLMRRTLFERDLGRAVARSYKEYHLVTVDRLRELGRFTVITSSGEEDELRHLLPKFRLRAVGVDEYVAELP